MKRTSKQIVFSLLYIVIFFLIGLGIWSVLTKQTPTCSDGIKNQTETGVDCGGGCISCELKNIEPIEFLGYSIMPLKSGKVSLLVHVKNPNETHHASPFSYKIHLFDESGIEREVFSGESSLIAGSEGYLFEGQGRYSDPADVKLEVTNVNWKSTDAFSVPRLLLQDITTNVEESVVRVKGVVQNSSSFAAENVHIIAILSGDYNEDVYASEMILTRVLGLGKEKFSVIFPNDPEIVKRLKTNQTRVIVQAE